MKVALLGSEGMLGSDMRVALVQAGHEVIAFKRQTLDVTRDEDLQQIAVSDVSLVINCTAYTNVDKAESDEEACFAVNTDAVVKIATICKQNHKALVQISTDYVFGGLQKTYNEAAECSPLNVYGRSKREAEVAIRKILPEHYIIRTAWLFGKNGRNFVNTIAQLSREKKVLKVVDDQVGCPTYTKDLAKSIVDLICTGSYGTYHLTNDGHCSWYSFAEEIVKNVKSHCVVEPCTSDEFTQKARRPKHPVLLNTKRPHLRSWREALREYIVTNSL